MALVKKEISKLIAIAINQDFSFPVAHEFVLPDNPIVIVFPFQKMVRVRRVFLNSNVSAQLNIYGFWLDINGERLPYEIGDDPNGFWFANNPNAFIQNNFSPEYLNFQVGGFEAVRFSSDVVLSGVTMDLTFEVIEEKFVNEF